MTHPCRNVLAANDVARGNPRRCLRHGRIDAQALLNTSIEVGQAGRRPHADGVLAGEGGADLVGQPGERARGPREVEGQAGQGAGGRLAAGGDEQPAVLHQLRVRHAPRGRVVPQHVGHDVLALLRGRPQGDAPRGFFPREVAEQLALFLALAADESPDQWLQHGVVREELKRGAGSDAGEDHFDPRMVLAGGQAVEGVGKGEVADDVKRRIVEPLDHVDRRRRAGKVTQPAEQLVDVDLDMDLLLIHGRLGEGVGEQATLPVVIAPLGRDDGALVLEKRFVLGELGAGVIAVGVYIAPGNVGLDGEAIRRYTDNGTVSVMKVLDVF